MAAILRNAIIIIVVFAVQSEETWISVLSKFSMENVPDTFRLEDRKLNCGLRERDSRVTHFVIHFAGLLRLAVQPLRLLRRDRLDQRDDLYKYTCDAASWRFRTPLRPAAQGIQSNKVSMTDQTEFLRILRAELTPST